MSQMEQRLHEAGVRRAAISSFAKLWGPEFAARAVDEAANLSPVPDPELIMATAIRLLGAELVETQVRLNQVIEILETRAAIPKAK